MSTNHNPELTESKNADVRPVSGARVAAYAEAIADPNASRLTPRLPHEHVNDWTARAVMAVADAELAGLRAEVERLRDEVARIKRTLEASNDAAAEAANARAEAAEARESALREAVVAVADEERAADRAEIERLRGEVAEAKAARDRWQNEVDYAAAGERLQARRDTWADIAATLNDRAVMWEQEGRRTLAQECKGMANACRTYAEGVGVPSVDSLRQKRREAQARLDALVADLRGLHRPDGGSGGPGAMCVECTPDFGTRYEEPVSWPCPTIAVLDKHAGASHD